MLDVVLGDHNVWLGGRLQPVRLHCQHHSDCTCQQGNCLSATPNCAAKASHWRAGG